GASARTSGERGGAARGRDHPRAPQAPLREGAHAQGGVIQHEAREMSELTITRPDDWHLHLRDGAALASVLPYTARPFARAIVMPNLRPPVTSVQAARGYRARILEALARANEKGERSASTVLWRVQTLGHAAIT